MPVIACPGCGKQYSVPATVTGQVAKCACGKRFRLGSTAASSATNTSSKIAPASASPSKGTPGEPAGTNGTLAGGVARRGKSSAASSSPNSTAVKTQPKPAAPKLATATTPAVAAPTKSTATAIRPSALEADDDFWNEGLKPDPKPKGPEPAATSQMVSGLVANSAPSNGSKSDTAPAKKKKKKKRASWGFDWGKVAVGLASFLFFGGLAVLLVMSTGRVSRGTIYLAFPAIGGLFTAINGVMGEEGIW